MKYSILLSVFSLLLVSCNDTTEEGNLIINGSIDGLKVGNVLLQQVQDSTLITLDSVAVDGNSEFVLQAMIEEPQLLYVHLDIKDGNAYDDRLDIFAEEGTLTLQSTLNDFEKNAKVSGSANDSVLVLFKSNKKRLDEAYTELVKRSITLGQQENPDPSALETLDNDYNKHIRKRVLYALNFAKLHKELEVAPYILISEAFDAHPKLLDSTYRMMPKKIQNSLYGKELSGLIELSRKENGL